MNKFLILILFYFANHQFTFAQELTVPETISYINSYLDSDTKISLSQEGMFEFTGRSDFDNVKHYKVHISEISSFVITSSSPFSNTKWGLRIKCGEGHDFNTTDPCIQEITSNGFNNISDFSIFPKDNSKYSCDKLSNAFDYLYSLTKETNNYKRVDNDPFAPQNFKKPSVDVSSNVKTGSIKLESQNGVYYIWVLIGTVKRKFVLDTGASDVLISDESENELINAGILKKTNYIASALYKIADGSIVQCRRIILPTLKIGNFIIKNVKASVGVGGTPLLLGKSFLDKFKKWTIDNESKTLNLEK